MYQYNNQHNACRKNGCINTVLGMGVRLVLTKDRVIRALIQVIQIVLALGGNVNKTSPQL